MTITCDPGAQSLHSLEDGGLHLSDQLLAIDFFEPAGAAVKIDQWCGLRVIDDEPIFNRRRLVVVALA